MNVNIVSFFFSFYSLSRNGFWLWNAACHSCRTWILPSKQPFWGMKTWQLTFLLQRQSTFQWNLQGSPGSSQPRTWRKSSGIPWTVSTFHVTFTFFANVFRLTYSEVFSEYVSLNTFAKSGEVLDTGCIVILVTQHLVCILILCNISAVSVTCMNQRETHAAWLTAQQRSMFWHWLNILQMKLTTASTDTCQTPRFYTLNTFYTIQLYPMFTQVIALFYY